MADKNVQLKAENGDKLFPSTLSRNTLFEYEGRSVYEELLAINNEAWKPATLINGFIVYTAGEMVGFKKKANTVYLCGTLRDGATTKPFVLPEGYRPGQTIRTIYLTSVGAKYITIEPNGVVTLNEYTNTMSFVSLDGISFAL